MVSHLRKPQETEEKKVPEDVNNEAGEIKVRVFRGGMEEFFMKTEDSEHKQDGAMTDAEECKHGSESAVQEETCNITDTKSDSEEGSIAYEEGLQFLEEDCSEEATGEYLVEAEASEEKEVKKADEGGQLLREDVAEEENMEFTEVQREGADLVKCFDLALVERLTSVPKNEEECNPTNVRVISKQCDGFDRREVVRDLLEEADVNSGAEKNGQPVVDVFINGEVVRCLADSGSDMCAISQRCLDSIPDKETLVVMPVSGVQIVVATGKVKKAVRHEVLLPVKIEDVVIYHSFLVIPGLSVDMLLGVDFFNLYRGKLDFQEDSVVLEVEGRKLCVPFAGKKMLTPEEIAEIPIRYCRKREEVEAYYEYGDNGSVDSEAEEAIRNKIDEKVLVHQDCELRG